MSAAADAALSLEKLATKMDGATKEAGLLFERAKSQQVLVSKYVDRHGIFDARLTATSKEISATAETMDPQWELMKKLKKEQPAVGVEMNDLHVQLLQIVLEQASISEEASKSAGLLVKLNDTMHDKHKTKHAMQEDRHKGELQTHVDYTAKVQQGLDTLQATHKLQNEDKVEVNRQFLDKVSKFVGLVEGMVTGGDNFMTTLSQMGGHLKSIKAELGVFEQHAGKTKLNTGNVVTQKDTSKKPVSMSPGMGFPSLPKTAGPKQGKHP